MNLPRAERAVPTPNARIQVTGRINLGSALRLDLRPAPWQAVGTVFSGGLPDSGVLPAIDGLLPVPGGAAFGGQPTHRPLQWTLTPEPGTRELTDNALTASYGIFGAPGSGKTHLLLHILRQLLALHADDPERRYGGMVLDPKAALIEDVADAAARAGRSADLVVLNTDELARTGAVNILDVALDPAELGRVLVLAAQSSGVGASEPFWFGAWSNLFSAALPVLRRFGAEVLNLRWVLEEVLTVEPTAPDGTDERRIQRRAREARLRLGELTPDQASDLATAINQIEGFYRQEPDNIATVESLITQAYGGFTQSRWSAYSARQPWVEGLPRTPFYDRIIDDGAIVLVSVSTADPAMAKVICTLVKVLFQQTVLSRLGRVRSGTLQNFSRPVVLACDEYSDVASEVPGQPMGDGYFFSLARQNGAMGLIATQSVNMLQASSLKENWKAVFSNFGAKIFMRLADNETAEEASKLVGESDWYVTGTGSSRQGGDLGSSAQTELRERKGLPTHVLTQVLGQGRAVVVGSLDGGRSAPGTYFVQVPGR